MTRFVISIAGVNVEATVLFPETREFCRNYIADAKPQVSVCVCEDDLMPESYLTSKTGGCNVHYSAQYLETLALYRKITCELLKHDIILMHGAVISYKNDGYMFTAASGTGKTTHISLWKQVYGDSVTVINGDKPLLRITDDGIVAYGTPWMGKENLGCNQSVRLKAICHLNRGEENSIVKSDFGQMLPILLQQTHQQSDTASKLLTLDLVGRMQNIDFYKLWCNMNPDAAVTAYEGMK